jgi:cytochrome c oxidase subunit 1/cytochrome c oxidase subunit I+III
VAATTTAEQRMEQAWEEARTWRTWFTTVDHKRIGVRYLVTGFVFFVLGGIEALVIRAQLAVPDARLVGPEAFNQLFSMHGITMIFLFITPTLSGFGNFIVPLQVGARDMAFPRLNAFGYWVFLASGLFMYGGMLFGVAPNNGWFNYAPLSVRGFSPGLNIEFYVLGLIFLGISTTAGAINFIVTILKLRAPGMTIARMPLFCWALLAASFSIVFALPALTAANIMLLLERRFDFHFFAGPGGDAVLWQHLFWIFGHPDVYIIFLPAVGIVSSVIPVFSRRPIVGYSWVALATVATGIIGFGVWVHHMFAVGLPQISMGFFAAASMIITLPSGVQVFAWISTLLAGRPALRTPLLFALGFVVLFVIGGVTGVMFAAVPFDQQITDSYFVVAHFHYVLFGGAVFPVFAGLYYWVPKITGRLLDDGLGKWSFWLMFLGFNLAFFPMHIAGLLGMPRRVWTWPEGLGWETHNLLATVGAFVLAVGILVTVVNLARSRRGGEPAGDDPWAGDTLEWATTSPPPHFDFAVIPEVRDRHPNWDVEARTRDAQRARSRETVLAEGHETVATSVLDADLTEVMRMPEESVVPLLVTGALTVVFVGFLTEIELIVASAGMVLFLASVAAWHRRTEGPEP